MPSGNTRRLRFLADDHDDVSLRLVGQKLFVEVVCDDEEHFAGVERAWQELGFVSSRPNEPVATYGRRTGREQAGDIALAGIAQYPARQSSALLSALVVQSPLPGGPFLRLATQASGVGGGGSSRA